MIPRKVNEAGKNILTEFIFSLFISDIETPLNENVDAGITLEQLSLYLILFADDMILFSDTPEGLQLSLVLQNVEFKC